MPNMNVLLYAKWAPPTFVGIAHLMVYGAGGGTYDLGTIPYGGTISSSALNAARAEAELYKPNTTDTFGGWLIDRGGSRTLFNANMQIYEDVVLYPQWISGGKLSRHLQSQRRDRKSACGRLLLRRGRKSGCA